MRKQYGVPLSPETNTINNSYSFETELPYQRVMADISPEYTAWVIILGIQTSISVRAS